MTLWKSVERKIAKLLDGKRVPITGRVRGDVPDVEHETLSIEVKHRENLPAWIKDAYEQAEAANDGTKLNIVVLHEKYMRYKNSFVLLTLEDFMEILDLLNEL